MSNHHDIFRYIEANENEFNSYGKFKRVLFILKGFLVTGSYDALIPIALLFMGVIASIVCGSIALFILPICLAVIILVASCYAALLGVRDNY